MVFFFGLLSKPSEQTTVYVLLPLCIYLPPFLETPNPHRVLSERLQSFQERNCISGSPMGFRVGHSNPSITELHVWLLHLIMGSSIVLPQPRVRKIHCYAAPKKQPGRLTVTPWNTKIPPGLLTALGREVTLPGIYILQHGDKATFSGTRIAWRPAFTVLHIGFSGSCIHRSHLKNVFACRIWLS